MARLKVHILGTFFVLYQLLKLSEEAISFTKEPDDPSYVKKGNNATLVWDYSVTDRQTELKFIAWAVDINNQYKNLIVESKNGDRVVSSGIPAAYIGRVGIEGRASLVIENITAQDSTVFRCFLRPEPTSGLPVQVSTTKLIATEAPKIMPILVNDSYSEGSTVTISCTATGIPEPDVDWKRNGKVISTKTKTASLTFGSINKTDSGSYICTANNIEGRTPAYQVTLVVNYKPEGTKLVTSAAKNTVTQGDTVTFTCHVTAAQPQVSQYRFYNDTTLVKDSNDSQYTINNVQRSHHYGKYKCVPHNDVGDGPEATVTLNVNVPAQFTVMPQNVTVNETDPIAVSCNASGFPTPSVKWEKYVKGKPAMKVPNIQTSHRSDAGMYVCTASNGVGQDETAKAYVTVQYPATVQEVTSSAAKSWIGQTVTLTCVSDGVPTPTLTWYNPDGNKLNTVTAKESRVTVMINDDQDFGEYKCFAFNGLTPSDIKRVNVKQIKQPGSPAIISSGADIQATSLTVKWTAPADDGGSPITAYRVVILKDNIEIKNVNITDPGSTSLSVGGLERDTNYNVKVFARNAVFEGPAEEKAVKTKYEGVPGAAEIDDLPSEVTDDTITLKWSEPQKNGGEITQYTLYRRIVTDGEPGEWIKLETIKDVSVREREVKLEKGKVNEFVVTATNKFGESFQEEGNVKKVMALEQSGEGGGPQTGGGGDDDDGIGPAIYAGAAAAGVLLIIGIIVIIVLWRRRKPPSQEETSADELGRGNPYEIEDGYQSVSREAAQSLQPSDPVAEPNYAQVDPSKKKKNRRPPTDEYAQVDKSKKSKKKKKPGELDYADLGDLRADLQLEPVPAGAAAAPIVRPPAYEGTEYAEISQFGVPQPDPTYANVPKKEVVYSNVEMI